MGRSTGPEILMGLNKLGGCASGPSDGNGGALRQSGRGGAESGRTAVLHQHSTSCLPQSLPQFPSRQPPVRLPRPAPQVAGRQRRRARCTPAPEAGSRRRPLWKRGLGIAIYIHCALTLFKSKLFYWSELMKEDGSGGVGIVTDPSSICVTFSMVGRIVGSSWRHHNATATKRSTFFMLKIASSSPLTNKSSLPLL